MPRRLRYVVPGELVEITQRTFQGRPLLRPDPVFNAICLGVLARAQRRYEMVICAFIVLSNHYHLDIRPRDAKQMAAFVGYFNGNLAREIARLRDWPERVWGRRYSAVPVTREREAQIARLKYVLSQGVKEGLVAKAHQWPGVSGLAQMLDPNHQLVGLWYDRTAAYRLRQAGLEVRREDWISEERVVLSPIPALEKLSVAERTAFIEALVREIEAEAQAELLRPVAGAEVILAQNPIEQPRKLRRSPIPLVHAASLAAWIAFKETYRAFVAEYQLASTRLRAGARDVVFPAGSFPPAMPFVACAPT